MLFISEGSTFGSHRVVGPNFGSSVQGFYSNYSGNIPLIIPVDENDSFGRLSPVNRFWSSSLFQGNTWNKCEGDRACFHTHIDGIISSKFRSQNDIPIYSPYQGYVNRPGMTISNPNYITFGWTASFTETHQRSSWGYVNLLTRLVALRVDSTVGGKMPAIAIVYHTQLRLEVNGSILSESGSIYCCSYHNRQYPYHTTDGMYHPYSTYEPLEKYIQWAQEKLPSIFTSYADINEFSSDSAVGVIRLRYGQDPVPSWYIHTLRDKLRDLYSENLPILRSALFGQACVKAIQDARALDINTIAYLADFRSLLAEFKDMLYVYKHPTNPKAWAKYFLGLKYGTQLTLSDTKELAKAINNLGMVRKSPLHLLSTCRARESDSFYLFAGVLTDRMVNYKIYYSPYDNQVLKFIKNLIDWDIWPDLQNLWDFIPLSFVADWFFNIEENLVILDAANYSQYLEVSGVTASTRDVTDFTKFLNNNEKKFVHTDLKLTVYDRRVKPFLDPPLPSFSSQESWRNHLAEMTAIILSKL